MYVKNLKIGDKFTHHEFGQTEITDYAERAALCKSESCPSFMVDEDYVAIDPVFAKPSIGEIAEILKGYGVDEFAELKTLMGLNIDLGSIEINTPPTVNEMAEIFNNLSPEDKAAVVSKLELSESQTDYLADFLRKRSFEQMEKIILEIFSIRYMGELPMWELELRELQQPSNEEQK